MIISNKQKALIHVARRTLGMTDDEYRDFLSGFGVASCTQLDRVKFERVLKGFERLGFKRGAGTDKPLKEGGAAKPRPYIPAAKSKDKLLVKIAAIRAELNLPRGYVDAISRNMFGVDVYTWCDADQLYRIVAALSYHQKRQRGKANGP